MIIPDPFPTPETWYQHRVSYGETDGMAQVYYGEFFHLFERARGQHIRDLGMSYAEVERRGVLLPVREAGCRYRKPLRYDDLIWVRAAVGLWKRASLIFVYEIWDAPRTTVMATGFTEHANVGPDGRPQRFPDWFRQLCQADGIAPST